MEIRVCGRFLRGSCTGSRTLGGLGFRAKGYVCRTTVHRLRIGHRVCNFFLKGSLLARFLGNLGDSILLMPEFGNLHLSKLKVNVWPLQLNFFGGFKIPAWVYFLNSRLGTGTCICAQSAFGVSAKGCSLDLLPRHPPPKLQAARAGTASRVYK